jgi:hypothetical protein
VVDDVAGFLPVVVAKGELQPRVQANESFWFDEYNVLFRERERKLLFFFVLTLECVQASVRRVQYLHFVKRWQLELDLFSHREKRVLFFVCLCPWQHATRVPCFKKRKSRTFVEKKLVLQ